MSSARRLAQGVVPRVLWGFMVLVAAPVPSSAQPRVRATHAVSREHASAWRGGIVLDEPARDGLRVRTPEGRETAAAVSDALLSATILSTAALSLAGPLARGDAQLAGEASTLHLLSLALTVTLGDLAKRTVGRARPFERACRETPSAPGCESPDTFASFYSLHAGIAFTSAGFSCGMGTSHSLSGDPVADAAFCGVSLAFAAATGLLRIAADRHYLSDVIVGAIVGFLIGYAVPLALLPSRASVQSTPAPTLSPAVLDLASGAFGVSVGGRF